MTTSLHEPAAAEVGRLLREARLARGEELAAAAEELRVRPACLEALEEGRLGRLLAPVYVVGQTRAYARHLGLDGAELARRLKAQAGRAGAPGAKGRKPAAGRWRAAASLAGLLLLGAAAYAGYRAGFRAEPGATPAPSPAAAVPASASVTAAADPGGTAAPPSDGPREATSGPAPVATAETHVAEARTEPQPAPVADPSPPPAASTPAAAATAPAPVQTTDAPAPAQAADAPPPPAAPAARNDAAATSGAPPAAGTGDPAPPAPPPPAADTAGTASEAPAAPGAPEATTPQAVAAGPGPAAERFAIQVASLRDPAGATDEWRRLVRLHPSLAGLEPQPARAAEIPGKGRFYRVLGGAFATRAEAQAACARLLAEGSYCRPVLL